MGLELPVWIFTKTSDSKILFNSWKVKAPSALLRRLDSVYARLTNYFSWSRFSGSEKTKGSGWNSYSKRRIWICQIFKGSRNRTRANGFEDRCSTTKLYPYVLMLVFRTCIRSDVHGTCTPYSYLFKNINPSNKKLGLERFRSSLLSDSQLILNKKVNEIFHFTFTS